MYILVYSVVMMAQNGKTSDHDMKSQESFNNKRNRKKVKIGVMFFIYQ